MEAIQHLVRPTRVEQTTGRVVRVDGATVVVRTAEGERTAGRAESCLLEPTPNDLVLLACVSPGHDYVLAVLERTSAAAARLSASGDLEIAADAGSLAFRGRDGIRLSSDGALGLVARSLGVVAREGTLLVRSLVVESEGVYAQTGKLALFAKAVESVAERVSAHFGNVYRTVDELERVQAGQLQLRAKGNVDLRGDNAIVAAKRLVKVAAEQVHMG